MRTLREEKATGKNSVYLCVDVTNGNLSDVDRERPFEFLKGPIITEAKKKKKNRLTGQMVCFT